MKNILLCGLLVCCFAEGAPRTGEQIYTAACVTCHATGVANAPKVHDQAAWQARYDAALAKVKETSPNLATKDENDAVLTYLVSIVKHGLNAMPAGGMCTDCTDEEYKAAIEYMRSKQ